MRFRFTLLACLLLSFSVLSAAPPADKKPAEPEKKDDTDKVDWSKVPLETVLKLIKRFEEDPLKAKEDGIAGALLDFAGQSEDVFVVVNVAFLPHIGRKGKHSEVLLAAFIIGDVRPQVVGKTKKQDHALEGLKMLLAVYSRLLKDKQIDSVPEYDTWAKLDDKGLAEFVAKNKKAEKKEEKKEGDEKK